MQSHDDHRRSADAVGALGMAYHADLFYEPAVAAYERAAALDAHNWRWPYFRALVHLERGDAARATRRADARSSHANPGLTLAWWRLGEAEFKQARYDEADAAYARAEAEPRPMPTAGPASVRTRERGRARVALHRGIRPAAVALLRSVLEGNPRFGAGASSARGRVSRAGPHRRRGASRRARARRFAPTPRPAIPSWSTRWPTCRGAACSCCVTRRRRLGRESAVAASGSCVGRSTPIPAIRTSSTKWARRSSSCGAPATRCRSSRGISTCVDDDLQTLVQIGKCQTDLGRLDEAEATLRRALALGDDAVGHYNLGVVLEQRGRIDEAEASYRRAIAVGPGLAGARNNLGALLAAQRASGRSRPSTCWKRSVSTRDAGRIHEPVAPCCCSAARLPKPRAMRAGD